MTGPDRRPSGDVQASPLPTIFKFPCSRLLAIIAIWLGIVCLCFSSAPTLSAGSVITAVPAIQSVASTPQPIAVAVDAIGNLYMGTGPTGRVQEVNWARSEEHT